MPPHWKIICTVDDIPALGARVVRRADAAGIPLKPDVAIFRSSEDRLFALLDRCPHKGGPLSQGIVFGDQVACPLHGWNIALGAGCAVDPDQGCTQKFSLKVEGNQVFLDAAELALPAPAGLQAVAQSPA